MDLRERLSATHRLFVVWLIVAIGSARAADYPLKPVPFIKVEMTSDFWRPRLQSQRKTLVPFAFERTQPGVEHLKAARDFLAGRRVFTKITASHTSPLDTVSAIGDRRVDRWSSGKKVPR